jgi:hypothetical protein
MGRPAAVTPRGSSSSPLDRQDYSHSLSGGGSSLIPAKQLFDEVPAASKRKSMVFMLNHLISRSDYRPIQVPGIQLLYAEIP